MLLPFVLDVMQRGVIDREERFLVPARELVGRTLAASPTFIFKEDELLSAIRRGVAGAD